MTINQQMQADQRLKRIFNSSPIFEQYAKGHYKPEEFIEEFDLLLEDSERKFINELPGIKVIFDAYHNKTVTVVN